MRDEKEGRHRIFAFAFQRCLYRQQKNRRRENGQERCRQVLRPPPCARMLARRHVQSTQELPCARRNRSRVRSPPPLHATSPDWYAEKARESQRPPDAEGEPAPRRAVRQA